MQQSFYNFLIDRILADFFKANIAKRGEHYSIIIENDENRKNFIDAIKASIHTKPLVVKDIYDGAKPGMRRLSLTQMIMAFLCHSS